MASQPNPTASQPDAQSPFHEPAEGILRGDTSITDADRESLFDMFHGSKDHNELAAKLQPLADIPEATKHALWTAKKSMTPAPPAATNVDKVSAAIQKLSQIDPATLDIAEKHPTISKAMIDAAVKPPEANKAVGGESKTVGKGKTAKTPAPLAQPPRIDGMPHLPPIGEGQHRILASDGSVHDIPAANLEKARQIDPLLHVLNP